MAVRKSRFSRVHSSCMFIYESVMQDCDACVANGKVRLIFVWLPF
jgi:hypothetical protein